MTDGRPFRVLAVCTGNICRSPAVELLLAHGLAAAADVTVSSAGTRALVGQPVSGPMAELLEEGGVDPSGFTARQLDVALLRDADLVLTADRGHRSAVVSLHPPAVRRAFTVRELARLAEHVDPAALPSGPEATAAERLAAAVPLLQAQRGLHRAAEPWDDDVLDPYRQPMAVYRSALDLLLPGVRAVLALAGAS